MTQGSLITVAWSVAAIATFFAFWQYGIKPWLDAWVRQRLFVERDALFDRGSTGEIEFESYDYQQTRILLNAHIRFFHRLDGLQIVSVLLFKKYHTSNDIPDAAHQIEDAECRATLQRAIALVFTGALLKSPLIALALLLIMLYKKLNGQNTSGDFIGRELDRATPYFDDLARSG